MPHGALETVYEYYRSLEAGGPASQIAAYFHLPAALIVGDEKLTFEQASDVEALYDCALSRYRSEGIAKISWDDTETSVFQVYPNLVLVKTVITRDRADGSVVKRWACSYLVRQLAGNWRFDVVTAIPN